MKAKYLPLMIALTVTAHGRVGDGEAEIEKAYGEPQRVLKEHEGFRTVSYSHDDFLVSVGYLDGVSKREGFARRGLAKFSDEDVRKLLALSEGSEKGWEPLDLGDGRRYWRRSDGKVIASLSRDENFLIVQEKDFREPK